MKTARIVVLGVALAAGGAAMFLVGGQKAPAPIIQALPAPPQIQTDDVLTAAKELPMGTLIAKTDLAWTTWPTAAIGAGMLRRSEAPNVIDDMTGGVARASFVAGEPIRREKIVKGPNAGFMSAMLPSGYRAVAINIDSQGSTSAGGFVLPNDRVDVLRTFHDDDAGKDGYSTQVLLSNIRVLAIGQNVQEKNGQPVVVGSTATLEVDPHQAEILILGQRVGTLSLVLRSMLDSSPNAAVPPPDQPQDGSLTVVRFGVAQTLGKR
jgi:pilus assembly protein CpaB